MGEEQVSAFIARWRSGEGGAERANYALFLVEMLDLLDLPHPDPADARHGRNDYVFERAVRTVELDGTVRNGRIDLYRRGCFVLEAKQSRWKDQSKEIELPFRTQDAVLIISEGSPRRPDWPEADYVVGNPPFIGGKDVRARLGDGYAAALWRVHPHVNRSADLVMYWWIAPPSC